MWQVVYCSAGDEKMGECTTGISKQTKKTKKLLKMITQPMHFPSCGASVFG